MANPSISPLAGPRFHYVTAVWGSQFTHRFVDAVLPTNCSPNNLAALGDRVGDIYRIYTTPEDSQTIVKSEIYQHLTQYIDVRIESIEPWRQRGLGKYRLIGQTHQAALQQAHAERAAAVFLSPDAVFADGAFARLRALTLQGKRRILVAGFRAEASGWLREVRERCPQEAGRPWTVGPRDAMGSALRHAHPWTRATRWDAPRLNAHPSHLYFPVVDQDDDQAWDGAICRTFHAHPLLVWPREIEGAFRRTIDGDLAAAVPAEPDEVHLVTDSDEIAAVELSDADAVHINPRIDLSGRAVEVARWAREHADAEHWCYFKQPIRLRGSDVSGDRWHQAESVSNRAADEIVAAAEGFGEADVENGAGLDGSSPKASTALTARLHFIVPVWGQDYIERFLRWGLPSFLAAQNLPAVADRTHSFDIVTDHKDLNLFEHPAMDRLRSVVSVKLRTPADDLHREGLPDDSLGYTKMTRYYNAAVTAQDRAEIAHVFLTPEGVFSDGMFPAILRRLDEGARAVALPGFRVLEDTAIDDLLAAHLNEDRTVLTASPRELVRWVLEHPHPITRAHAWGEAWGKSGPRMHPHYYWLADDEGWVAHCFHVHPLCVWPKRPGFPVPAGQTLDHEYLQQAVAYRDIHLVRDTDEMCVIDIARDGHLGDTASDSPYDVRDVAEFASLWTNGYHRGFFERGIRVHAGPIDATSPAWREAESRAKAEVEKVLRRVGRATEMPFYANARIAAQYSLTAQVAHAARPWWVRGALGAERRRAALLGRVEEVGWLRAFAVRTRVRAAGRRAVERFTLSPEDRGRGRQQP
ncbi:MAG: hypothetical protein AAGH92_03655 [Planctomycetota bacterium]